MKIIRSAQGIIEEKGTASVRAPYKVRVSMLALDVFLGNLMTLTAVLVLLKIKNVIMWDWGTVLSPVCVVLLMKGFLIFLNHAFQGEYEMFHEPGYGQKGGTLTPYLGDALKENMSGMKKAELRGLIEEHMVLSKRIEHLKEELKKSEDRYKKVGEFLYGFRSQEFLQSVLSCLMERMNECGQDECFDELMHTVIGCLKRSKDFGGSKEFTSKHIWRVFDEKVE